MDLNEKYISSKNLLNSSGSWVNLLHLDILNGPDARIACNADKSIIWNGYKWTALRVEIGIVRESKEEIPQVELRISNITSIPESYANDYEGLIASAVTFYEIDTNNLAETEDIRTFEAEITESNFDSLWAHFKIGSSPNPFNVQDPKDVMLKNFCRFDFPNNVDSRCPYEGVTYTTCNRTLAHCIIRNPLKIDNRRFGGFPALGTNKLYVD